MSTPDLKDPATLAALMHDLRAWAAELGFQQLSVADTDVRLDSERLQAWLDQGLHGELGYMKERAHLRAHPEELVPGTLRIISVRMNYSDADPDKAWATLADGERAYVSRYAMGRDYHKVIRSRLQKLATRLAERIGPFGYRAFTDSAPVLEKALASKSGQGWVGKHTLIINKSIGSWFFLGELFTDLPLPVDEPVSAHCGTCVRCIDVCPTQAIIAPYVVDARRCISYLTIENKGAIPEDLRKPMGNRIFGCDDCQLACPWNKFAQRHDEPDFRTRNELDKATLVDLFAWEEDEFLRRTEGSPLRRAGYIGWLRNIAVALGNAPTSKAVIAALHARIEHPSELVREHVAWALKQHGVP
jgi:epoxyqueuosine reductase